VNLVAVTKLVPSIVTVPEIEREPEMGVGIACRLRLNPAVNRMRQVVLRDVRVVFICVFVLFSMCS
jgi:hypothetical protein